MNKLNPLYYLPLSTPLGIAIISWQKDQLIAFVLPQPTIEEASQILQSYRKDCTF